MEKSIIRCNPKTLNTMCNLNCRETPVKNQYGKFLYINIVDCSLFYRLLDCSILTNYQYTV